MAVAVDASTPERWTGTWNVTTGGSITSAEFTAPANSLLVVCVEANTQAAAHAFDITCSDSGGLTWTRRVERNGNETATGGYSVIFTARPTSAVSRTVTVTGNDLTPNTGGWVDGRASAKCYVLTGVDVDGTPVDTVGASNEGGSNTNDLTTSSITPGATGLLIAADAEWNALGAFQASSDLTQDTATYSGSVSVCDGYKAVTSGVAATANLNAAGTSAAQHKWCQIIVREAAGGGVSASASISPSVSASASASPSPAASPPRLGRSIRPAFHFARRIR